MALCAPITSRPTRGAWIETRPSRRSAPAPLPPTAATPPTSSRRPPSPLAATNDALWLVSSAGVPSGFFYDIWSNPDLPYTRFCATAHGCPRISESHLVQARLDLGELRFRREYLCHFTTEQHPLFPHELLDDSFHPWVLEAE
jgi:hypothetical protein